MTPLLNSEGDSHRKLDWRSSIPLDILHKEFTTLLGADIDNPLFGKIIASWKSGGLTTYGVATLIQKERENPGEYEMTMRKIFIEASNGYTAVLIKQIQERSKLAK